MLANKGLTMTSTSTSSTRRSFLAGSAATGAVSFLPMHSVAARDVRASKKSNHEGSPIGKAKADAILPFRVNVPGEDLADLRRRLAATRWPTKELVEDRSQGVQLATLRALARYWSTEYDWRKCEARLNALPQFMTKIDGVEIHFIHIRSEHEGALPLIMTHGWPGSVLEFLDTVGPLTDPTKYGGTPHDAFHLVLPSLPGYGFSGEPTELGWDAARIARAWAKLMDRLGYTRFVAQGGDVGAAVTDAMGRQAPKGLLGIHVNLLAGRYRKADWKNLRRVRAAGNSRTGGCNLGAARPFSLGSTTAGRSAVLRSRQRSLSVRGRPRQNGALRVWRLQLGSDGRPWRLAVVGGGTRAVRTGPG